MNIKFVIEAFRAMDNIPACEKYVEGHVRVLKIYGITMITSANPEWFEDPYTYVILVKSEDGEKIYGGARIKVAGGTLPLPIETALTKFDPTVHKLVKDLAPAGTGELCGLWNSREVAGYGIGSIYLGRVGVALATQLKLNSLFALCAPATVKNCMQVGFELETRLGNEGTFYYPKEGLVATAVLLSDCPTLVHADPDERASIMDIRNNWIQRKVEIGPKERVFEIIYDLHIPNITEFPDYNTPDI
jgi:hypothetical protein